MQEQELKPPRALIDIAVNAENQVLVAQAGAISPLVSLLRDNDTVVRQEAAWALANLSVNAQNQTAIVQANAVELLQRLAKTDANATTRTKAQTILNNCQSAIAQTPSRADARAPLSAEKKAAKEVVKSPVVASKSSDGTSREADDYFDMQGLENALALTIIPRDKIMLGLELGRGGFGIVYQGTWKYQTVAVKCYDGMRLPEKVEREVRHEISMILKLQHECLIRLLGLVRDDGPPMIVMEYGANGSLYNYLQSTQSIP